MIDEKDLKILEILRKNSRTPYSKIAKIVGISDVAVTKRIRKLEQLGLIRKYTVIVDPKKLGYNAVSMTGIDVEPENIFHVLSYLKEKNYVKYLALASGDHVVVATIWGRNGNELAQIHKEIAQLPGVKRVCPAIILDVVKED